MPDRATLSLEHIKNSGDYVLIPDFVVFDEHDEYDSDGKLLRRFDRARLEKIVEKTNALAEKTGDLATIAAGHTLENPRSEEDQPAPWGFAADWRLGNYGPEQKLGILCNAYIQRNIRTKDGKVVDGPELVKTFPRRSPELWPNHESIPEHARNAIDWIALLRRAPQRPLGLAVYHMNARREVIGGTTRRGKLRYAMESPMPDPTQPPTAETTTNPETEGADNPPAGHEEFAQHLDYAMKNHPHLKHLGAMCKKYGMEEATATDTGLPDGGDPNGDVMKNQRKAPGADDVQKTSQQRQLDDLKKKLDRQEVELALERGKQRVARYQMELDKLAEEFVFDPKEELEDCKPLDEAGFEKHVNRIKTRYARTPVGGDLPPEVIGDGAAPGTQKLDDPKVFAQIDKYMRANPEFVQKHGQNAMYEAAKILKFA